ncbi:MAG: hypothetical protein JO328_08250 [Hyphomicrobiales bacterium]|nr:hypothetical protein [Hyphomicrobiales bacterium]
MDDISYIPGVAASAIVALFLWWAIGRYRQSPLKTVLAAAGGVSLGYVIYLVLIVTFGIIAAVLRPDLARETGAALGHGFAHLPVMLMVVDRRGCCTPRAPQADTGEKGRPWRRLTRISFGLGFHLFRV